MADLNPLAPGVSTSEGKIAIVFMALSTLGVVAPGLLEMFTNLRDAHPQSAALATAASIVSLIVGALVATGYAKQRTTLKVAALNGTDVPVGTTVPAAAGFARLSYLSALAVAGFLALALASCATMKGASGAASVTTASGATVTVVAGNGTECISDTHWLALPGSNLECNSICATQVPDAVTISVPCRVHDQPATVVMIQFPIPMSSSKPAQ